MYVSVSGRTLCMKVLMKVRSIRSADLEMPLWFRVQRSTRLQWTPPDGNA